MSEQKKVMTPDGYYMQDTDGQGWTFHETESAQDCGKCKYRLAVIEAMRIGEFCEKVKVVPVPKKATGKTGAIYILDDERIIKGTEE